MYKDPQKTLDELVLDTVTPNCSMSLLKIRYSDFNQVKYQVHTFTVCILYLKKMKRLNMLGREIGIVQFLSYTRP